MKKNGFIATSLIYSFFLVFITLFLSIIADYLQDKLLLNEIEKGIKSEINDSMGIKDFEVGDVLFFTQGAFTDSKYSSLANEDSWIVSNVYINEIDKNNSYLILYSYKTDYSDSCLTLSNVYNDLNFAYLNDTFIAKTLYNFDGNKYKIEETEYDKTDKQINSTNIENYKDSNETLGFCRKRHQLFIGNDKLQKEDDSVGFITLKGVA